MLLTRLPAPRDPPNLVLHRCRFMVYDRSSLLDRPAFQPTLKHFIFRNSTRYISSACRHSRRHARSLFLQNYLPADLSFCLSRNRRPPEAPQLPARANHDDRSSSVEAQGRLATSSPVRVSTTIFACALSLSRDLLACKHSLYGDRAGGTDAPKEAVCCIQRVTPAPPFVFPF